MSAVASQTVILAAGLGARLGGDGPRVPKPLTTVAGLPLVAHALAHAEASGCVEALVVIGHEGAQVRRAIQSMASRIAVSFVENPDPTGPNGESLLVAEPHARDRFFLQMVDHIFTEPVLPQLAARPFAARTQGRVLVDRAPLNLDLADATKVRLDDDVVVAIGKGIEPWDAIDAGCFLLTPAIFDALRAVPSGEPRTVSSGMRQLCARRALSAQVLSGVRWMDVDTPDDRAEGERLLAARAVGADTVAP